MKLIILLISHVGREHKIGMTSLMKYCVLLAPLSSDLCLSPSSLLLKQMILSLVLYLIKLCFAYPEPPDANKQNKVLNSCSSSIIY